MRILLTNKVISVLDWVGLEWLLSVHSDSLKDVGDYSIESVRQNHSLVRILLTNKVISVLDWVGLEWLLSVHSDSLKDVGDYSIESVRQVNILACIILHHICTEKRDLTIQNLDFKYDSVTNRKRSWEELRDIFNLVTGGYTIENSKGAQSVRKALSDYF